MRVIVLALALIAVPVMLSAQEQADLAADPIPTVQIEESATPDATLEIEAPQPQESTLEARSGATDDAALQEEGPSSKEWWYLVGAIVAGGIILALLL